MKKLILTLLLISGLAYADSQTALQPEDWKGQRVYYNVQNFTVETGDRASIGLRGNMDVSFCVDLGASDQVDVDIQLDSTGSWYEVSTDKTADFCDTFEGPISAIRLSIDTNTSNSFKFEVLSSVRGG